jgi:hypothetical protein
MSKTDLNIFLHLESKFSRIIGIEFFYDVATGTILTVQNA